MVGLDGVGGFEEESRLAGLDHTQVVEAVPGGDGVIADGLKAPHRGQLGLGAAHPEAGDLAAVRHLQGIAEDGGPAQLLHQGLGELLKGVAEDDDLGVLPQGVQKLLGPGERVDPGDGRLDLPDPKAVLLQNVQTPAHQLVIIGLIPGGPLQLGDAAGLGEGDPDLRDQNALHIQTNNIHCDLLLFPQAC